MVVMLLIWIVLYSIWFWFVKDELATLLRDEATVSVTTSGVGRNQPGPALASYSLVGPKTTEYIVGVIGIIGFFLVGILIA